MKKNTLPKQDARRGAAMVEMALVLPVFLMVVMGVIEFGRGMMVSNLVTNAAREGARMAVLDGSTNADVTNAVTTFLRNAINPALTTSDIGVSITVTPAPGNPNPANVLANTSSRDLIQVQVTMPFNKVALIPGKYLKDRILTGSSAMRHE
jgi:Flp pilus assembly protein TadG